MFVLYTYFTEINCKDNFKKKYLHILQTLNTDMKPSFSDLKVECQFKKK